MCYHITSNVKNKYITQSRTNKKPYQSFVKCCGTRKKIILFTLNIRKEKYWMWKRASSIKTFISSNKVKKKIF
jgi:hypothetical protein